MTLGADLLWRPDAPAVLFGKPDATRVEALRCDIGADFTLTGAEPEARVRLGLGDGGTGGLRLVISPGDGDSFVSHLLGANPLAVDAGLTLDWATGSGLTIEGGAGFEIVKALDVTAGPLRIDRLRIAVYGGTGGAEAEAAVTGGVDLGVLAFVAEDVGLRAELRLLADGETGPFGPVALSLAFKPPTGFGVVIDAAGVMTGGGYLSVDAEAGRYAGVAQISFVALGLSAIGIIETCLPDRPDGWSMFLSVFSEFPPIQLGFGFVLIGVGGLVGINRTLNYDALQSRLLSGAMDSIMFPEDPVANAPTIIEDLTAVFPAAEGQFLFGAMFKLGWGTPALVEVDLGVIVELPDPIQIALLGQAAVALPTKEAAIIELYMDVAGVADLTAATFALDAVLRDSHIAEMITLSGAMSMRAELAGKPSMLLSVGGFHSAFIPPPGFPDLPRVGAQIPVGPLADVGLSGFLAITSNTFQMGGRVEVWAQLAGFTAEGHLGVEALIQFSPFAFEVGADFGVTVRAGKVTLMGVDVTGRLLGPSPVELFGDATFEILEFKKSLDLHVTTGGKKAKPKAVEPVAELIAGALAKAEALEARSDPVDGATVRLIEDTTGVDPTASLTLTQKIAPLGVELEKFGGASIQGPAEIAIDRVLIGAAAQPMVAVRDWFAPAQFFKMKDAEKLKAPSFEEMDAGVDLTPELELVGAESGLEGGYEQIVMDRALDPRGRRTPKTALRPGAGIVDAFEGRSQAARRLERLSRRRGGDRPAFRLRDGDGVGARPAGPRGEARPDKEPKQPGRRGAGPAKAPGKGGRTPAEPARGPSGTRPGPKTKAEGRPKEREVRKGSGKPETKAGSATKETPARRPSAKGPADAKAAGGKAAAETPPPKPRKTPKSAAAAARPGKGGAKSPPRSKGAGRKRGPKPR